MYDLLSRERPTEGGFIPYRFATLSIYFCPLSYAGTTASTMPRFSSQEPFAAEAHCTVSPTLKFSILLRLSRPFIADCQSTSLPAIERTAGTVKVRCTVVSLFLNALDMLAIRTILCRRMFLPVYAIFCDSCHIIPRDSYARPTVWGMKSPAGGGGAWGASAILTRANESSILNC